jgi:hypothetical protein
MIYFLKILKIKYPNKEPYKVELIGLEVIIHLPLEQPTNFQYVNPRIAPMMMPITESL